MQTFVEKFRRVGVRINENRFATKSTKVNLPKDMSKLIYIATVDCRKPFESTGMRRTGYAETTEGQHLIVFSYNVG